MAMIYVKTREGRRAFYEGRMIPVDHFVPVPNNAFIRRLINHHEDLEVRDDCKDLVVPAKKGAK
jgi:hypothetical protein